MQDKTIDNALLALRRQIIRGDGVGLDHAEALLTLRGVRLPRIYSDMAYRGHTKRAILGALQGGPRTLTQIVQHVADSRADLDYDAAYKRTAQCLYKMKLAGLVRHEGRVWLAP